MKKLLAIVLCIAMIASISVTAFADGSNDPDIKPTDTGTSSTLSFAKINLKPAVDQANKLYNSLSWLGASKTIVGLFNGFSTNYKTLLSGKGTSATAAREAVNSLRTVLKTKDVGGKTVFDVDDTQFISTSGLNYTIACVWNNLGNAFVGTVVDTVNETNVKAAAGTVTGAIANVELGVLNSMPAVPAVIPEPKAST